MAPRDGGRVRQYPHDSGARLPLVVAAVATLLRMIVA
jgi:hypothetical protein